MSKLNPVKQLGDRIKAAREEARLTQSELADRCGWFNNDDSPAQGRLSNYEKGVREPGIAEVIDIATATGRPLLYFYDINNDLQPRIAKREEARSLAKSLSTSDAKKLLDSLSRALPVDELMKAALLFSNAAVKRLGDTKA